MTTHLVSAAQFNPELSRELNTLRQAVDEPAVSQRITEIEEALLASRPGSAQEAFEILGLAKSRIATARACEGGEAMLPLAEAAVETVRGWLGSHFGINFSG